MSWAAVAGAGVTAAGSLISGASAGGTPAMNRVNTSNAFGGTRVINNGKGKPKTIAADLSPEQQGIFNQYQAGAGSYLGALNPTVPGAYGRAAGFGTNVGAQDVETAYNQFQNQGISFPGAQDAYASAVGGYGNMFGTAASAGYNAAFSGPSAGGLTNNLITQGNNALNQDYGQLEAGRLAQLRASAQPEEDRAVNAKFNSLFSRGQLGTSGGAAGIGQLAQAQQMADIQRQTDAGTYAQNQQQNNRGFATNMFSTALQGINTDQNYATSLGLLGTNAGQLGLSANKDLLNSFGARDTALLTRGQQRLSTAADLFGFGAGAQNNLITGAGTFAGGSRDTGGVLNSNQSLTATGQPGGPQNTGTGGNMFGTALQALGPAAGQAAGQYFQNRDIGKQVGAAINDPMNAGIF